MTGLLLTSLPHNPFMAASSTAAASQRQRAIQYCIGTIFIVLLSALCISLLYPILVKADHAAVPEGARHKRGLWSGLKMPRSWPDLVQVAHHVIQYQQDNLHDASTLWYVWGVIILVYTALQTFSIPGTLLLNVLIGAIFTKLMALPTICFCSANGATASYLLSYFMVNAFTSSSSSSLSSTSSSATRDPSAAAAKGNLFQRFWTGLKPKISDWRRQVREEHQTHLFWYLLFLRMTPFLPNWFINVASPHVPVPIGTFWLATFFGVIPLSLLHMQLGALLRTQLERVAHLQEAPASAASAMPSLWTWQNVAFLATAGVCAALPILLKRVSWFKSVKEDTQRKSLAESVKKNI